MTNVFCPTGPGGGIDPTCGKFATGRIGARDPLSRRDKSAVVAGGPGDWQTPDWVATPGP